MISHIKLAFTTAVQPCDVSCKQLINSQPHSSGMLHCIASHKGKDLIYTTVEALNHATNMHYAVDSNMVSFEEDQTGSKKKGNTRREFYIVHM